MAFHPVTFSIAFLIFSGYDNAEKHELEKLAKRNRGHNQRVDAVDLFRFFVLFFMIQGHLFRAYLLPAIRLEHWYKLHETLHGLVAPGFLFSAGFAAFLSFHNKRQNYIHFDRAFFKRLRRILFVIAIGYWIHLPFFSLRKTLRFISQGQAGEFLKTDILQCIGVGLLLFTFFAVALKNEKIVALISALAGALFFLLPETVKHIHLHPAIDPVFQLQRLHFSRSSPGPVFCSLGVIAAYVYVTAEKGNLLQDAPGPGHRFFPLVLFQIQPDLLQGRADPDRQPEQDRRRLSSCCGLSDWLLRRFKGPLLAILIKAGTESLFVYVLHLFIIFNSIFGFGLKPVFQNSLTCSAGIAPVSGHCTRGVRPRPIFTTG